MTARCSVGLFVRNQFTASLQARINEWVCTETRGNISRFLDEPLDPSTSLMLINAVHFKDEWKYPFPAFNTFKGTFHVSQEESVSCNMMTLSGEGGAHIQADL